MPARSMLLPVSLALAAVSGEARAAGGDSAPPPPADRSSPASPAATASPAAPPPAVDAQRLSASDPIRPPPLHVEYVQYGVAINALLNIESGAMCGRGVQAPMSAPGAAPCILNSGGGLTIRGGYRSPGPWYFGGAYAFAKMDSSNLFRLGILQQLWAEMRFLPDTGYRVAPFATAGLGGVAYGNEWGAETGGAMLFGGGGFQFEVSRVAVVGLAVFYKPCLIVGWTDTAGITRPTGVAHFLGFDVQLELRSELRRR